MKTNVPSFAKTTKLVSRALGMQPDELRSSFRRAMVNDVPNIINLRRRVIGGDPSWDDESYIKWRYDFEGRPDSQGHLMIVAYNDRLLGMIGAERVRLACGNERRDTLFLMDIMVDPELDGAGLGAWLNLAIFAENPLVFELGANPNSIGLITRLFHCLPNRKEYVAPLVLKHFLAQKIKSRLLAPILSIPVDIALKLWRAISSRRMPLSWSLQELTCFDDSVERLFVRRWAASEIMFERSSRYLNWRLFENPRAKYSVLAAFEGNEMMVYVAYQICTREDGMKIVRLVDWLVDMRHGFAGFSFLVQEIARRALLEKVDLVSISPLHMRLENFLWRLGFISRPISKYTTVGVRSTEPTPWPSLTDGTAWYLTDANTDLD